MASQPSMRREELERYLAQSREVQRVMKWVGVIGAAVALIAGALAGAKVFAILATLTAIVSGAGLWITHGHIEDFRKQLR